MYATPVVPRIAPVEPPYPVAVAALFAQIMPPEMPPLLIFRAAARNPRILAKMAAGNLLDRGSIERRDRELVILRACARCGAEYEWGVHVAGFAERVGLGPAQVAATVAATPDPAALEPNQRLLIRLVDELHDSSTVDDALWAELAAVYSSEQLIELVMLAGQYHMISFLVNALRLPPEPQAPRFAEVAAAPHRG